MHRIFEMTRKLVFDFKFVRATPRAGYSRVGSRYILWPNKQGMLEKNPELLKTVYVQHVTFKCYLKESPYAKSFIDIKINMLFRFHMETLIINNFKVPLISYLASTAVLKPWMINFKCFIISNKLCSELNYGLNILLGEQEPFFPFLNLHCKTDFKSKNIR